MKFWPKVFFNLRKIAGKNSSLWIKFFDFNIKSNQSKLNRFFFSNFNEWSKKLKFNHQFTRINFLGSPIQQIFRSILIQTSFFNSRLHPNKVTPPQSQQSFHIRNISNFSKWRILRKFFCFEDKKVSITSLLSHTIQERPNIFEIFRF